MEVSESVKSDAVVEFADVKCLNSVHFVSSLSLFIHQRHLKPPAPCSLTIFDEAFTVLHSYFEVNWNVFYLIFFSVCLSFHTLLSSYSLQR